jgi:ligand-binding SRPBCC domain-containing protein
MQIRLTSEVKQNYKVVMKRFDRKLFEFLKPPDQVLELIAFTGSKKGDRVHLKLKFPFFTDWVSDITADYEDEQHSFFIDQGTTLPPFLSYWHHKHIVQKVDENKSLIVDEMTFKAGWVWLTPILYPFIYFAFLPRVRAYKKYFNV